ncbi:MAG: hypothetical protein RL885_27830 [Planctomycetota bacterium]
MSRSNLVANTLVVVLLVAVGGLLWFKLGQSGTAVEKSDPNLALIEAGQLEKAAKHYLGLLEGDGRDWGEAAEGLSLIVEKLGERFQSGATAADMQLFEDIVKQAWPRDAIRNSVVEPTYAALVRQDIDRAVEIGTVIFSSSGGSFPSMVYPADMPPAQTEALPVEPIVYLEAPRAGIDKSRPEFRWHDASREDADQASYIVQLFDITGALVFENTVTGQSMPFPEDAEPLIQGMKYRWRVEPVSRDAGGPAEAEFHELSEKDLVQVEGMLTGYKVTYEDEYVWRFFLGNFTMNLRLYIGAERCFEKLREMTDSTFPRRQLLELYGPEHLNLPYRYNELLDE